MIHAPDPKTGYEGGVDEGYWVKNKEVIEWLIYPYKFIICYFFD
jgi:hypothetical protein